MKVAIVFLGLLACSIAVPLGKRMVYYQPNGMYYRAAPMTQRLMYVQYVQPAKANARSNGVATFVAGDSVATGSYIKDASYEEDVPVAEADEQNVQLKGNTAQSVAEAYPAENDEANVADEVAQGAKTPKELSYPVENEETAEDASRTGPVAEEDEAQNDAPEEDETQVFVPVKRYGPPKKVYVELDTAEEADYTPPARVPVYQAPAPQNRPTQRPTQRPSQKPKPQGQLPAGTFFPIEFGGTNGGAIAIANSFSTGEGGSATSHAIAYGSNDAARARKVAQEVRRH